MSVLEGLKGRDFLKLLDFTPEEISALLLLAARLKAAKRAGVLTEWFRGKNAALIFEKTSTRTRCAFEVAAHDLGMGTTYLDPTGSQIGKKESIADTARVLSGMYEGIEYRGFGQEIVEELARYASVPVWNGLTNEFHPTQMLADLLTMQERLGTLRGKRLTFFGDCRYNMADSWMAAGAKMGLHITLCGPEEYFPGKELTQLCRAAAEETGGSISLTSDPEAGAAGADVLYTDVWVSMGEPDEVWAERIEAMTPYRITRRLMEAAGPQALFMHCLPAFHDQKTGIGRRICEKFGVTEMEVEDEVFEGPQSVVFEEAENRMHTIKAVIAATLGVPESFRGELPKTLLES
ncbi:ornithine carbamoyltransferase [Lachnoclostridium sp. Marseille-P6806]|uniref:ornithine carbamoyltransferase n=1 Tax=Lachnoclostridium sp. Marseille-P6806 TaxID=2364793 RepID=UPI0010319DBC|nr:ornithine carbamoyltransferase [Lachnoclostridium sp. Marseille-P6806]